MRVIRLILRIVLLLVVVFFVGGLLLPSQWKVSRSTVMHAEPKQIYPLVNDFKEWEKWSPWSTKEDASLKYAYEGAESGVGAKQIWTSEKMGKGWMQLTAADPKKGVEYDLFIDMGASQSNLKGGIQFTPENNETRVTWTDRGDAGKSFVQRWMAVVFKPMLGKEMDKGLNQLKALVEENN